MVVTFDTALPGGMTLVRSTPEFDADSVPAGLLRAHQVADGVWGRLVVTEGTVDFVFEDTPDDIRAVAAGETQVIPPARLHHIAVAEGARFHVEFHREVDE